MLQFSLRFGFKWQQERSSRARLSVIHQFNKYLHFIKGLVIGYVDNISIEPGTEAAAIPAAPFLLYVLSFLDTIFQHFY